MKKKRTNINKITNCKNIVAVNSGDICTKKSVIAKKHNLRCPNSTMSPVTSPLRSSLIIA
jgi:hypothetical protein